MKIHPAPQGSEGWIEAKLGVPSASQVSKIIQPKKWKPSASQDDYICELIAEHFTRIPSQAEQSAFMSRGSQMERDAIAEYDLTHNVTTQAVGFCTLDDGSFGCSPDRLVGSDGLLEAKCRSFKEHVGALLGMNEDDYFAQCQAQMFVTGRLWVCRLSHNPDLPQHEVTFTRDEGFMEAFAQVLSDFTARLEEARAAIANMRLGSRVA